MTLEAIFHRKRTLVWLIKGYYKKRKKTLFFFFFAGLAITLFLVFFFPKILPLLETKNTKTVGIVGIYTLETLPPSIQKQMSIGLTDISPNGEATPAAAIEYVTTDNGKSYTFTLRDDLVWEDGKKVTAQDINYNFKDVTTHIDSANKITYVLKEPFAPFPTLVTKPLFRQGLIGIVNTFSLENKANFKVNDIVLDKNILRTLTLTGDTERTKNQKILYKFFPNETTAKLAFTLGEVSELHDIIDASQFSNWKNVTIDRNDSTDEIVTVFFNTTVPGLTNDDKNIRQALTYALPDTFDEGSPAASPISRTSWAFVDQPRYGYNIDTAKQLLKKDASASANLSFTITTSDRYKNIAIMVKNAWEKIGVSTKVEVVQSLTKPPEILLEKYRIPADPDQYALWHSTQQATNISHYSNPKIDKFLEDGRQTIDTDQRKEIYANFQKYLVDEAPAAFLFYPTTYTVIRN